MDSKKVIEKLVKIADKQQRIIQKLAQQAGTSTDPMEGALPEYKGPRLNVGPGTSPAPVAKKRNPQLEQLLAPIKGKLTEADWEALEHQMGMKTFEATDTTHPNWVPKNLQPNAPSVSTSPAGPATQGGPPSTGPKKLDQSEQKVVDLLNKTK